ncbi:unnamed protein product [Clonostachys chloroleuca]|uniref:NAD(P)-binding domain-containing protein n=1 Tax=Clonostachys chloroleuca TaxID=1926264 RepID=A0AA35PWG0_9HYPO|nr:unnamed protein product [Clonostachys chloroleuca]
MSSIKKVAIIGNGLDVTVISRSSQEVPAGARALQADYNSINSLSSALKGHDAVVSAVGAAGIVGQKVIIDAAILAGVKRFIPGDYGSEKAAAGGIEYTILSTGPFLDLVFGTPLFVDFQNRSVEFYGDGKPRLTSIGKAVAGTLVNADKTKNGVLHIQETVVSQVKVLDLAKTAAPGGAE